MRIVTSQVRGRDVDTSSSVVLGLIVILLWVVAASDTGTSCAVTLSIGIVFGNEHLCMNMRGKLSLVRVYHKSWNDEMDFRLRVRTRIPALAAKARLADHAIGP